MIEDEDPRNQRREEYQSNREGGGGRGAGRGGRGRGGVGPRGTGRWARYY